MGECLFTAESSNNEICSKYSRCERAPVETAAQSTRYVVSWETEENRLERSIRLRNELLPVSLNFCCSARFKRIQSHDHEALADRGIARTRKPRRTVFSGIDGLLSGAQNGADATRGSLENLLRRNNNAARVSYAAFLNSSG